MDASTANGHAYLVMTASYRTTPTKTARMPAGIPYIVGNEAAERFSFYGMKAILAVFMTEHLVNRSGDLAVMSNTDAKFYLHSFVVAGYLFPLIGLLTQAVQGIH